MGTSHLERRTDERIPTNCVATLRLAQPTHESLPVQLVDLSTGGAGLLATVRNSPDLGQGVELDWTPIDDRGAALGPTRLERGVVVNLGPAGRDVARIGIRFLDPAPLSARQMSPNPTLNTRGMVPLFEEIDPTGLLQSIARGHRRLQVARDFRLCS